MLVSVYLGINKKEVSILNEEIKGDKRYEYEVEESIPNKQYMVRRTSSGTFPIPTFRLQIYCMRCHFHKLKGTVSRDFFA